MKPAVALVSYSPLTVGGIETHLLQLMSALGGEFRFMAAGNLREPFLSRARDLGAECTVLPPAGKFAPAAVWMLRGLFRNKTIDIVHTHDTRGGLLGRAAARLAGIPVVHTAHTPSFFMPSSPAVVRLYRLAERILNHWFSDAVIFVSPTVERIFLDGNLVDPRKARLIPYGLEEEWFSPAPSAAPPDPGSFSFFFAGRLTREKGIPTLADAFARLVRRFPRARLELAGDGPEAEAVRTAAATGGWSAQLSLPGRLERAAVRQAMLASDAYVLPSLFESFPYSLMEAMACGLPCIATDAGGNRDLVENGATGLLVPLENPAALADAMIRLAEQPDLGRRMGAEGKRRIQEYSSRKMAEKISAVYGEILKNRGEKAPN